MQYKIILSIFIEILFFGLAITGIQHNSAYPVFWIAAAIEVAFGVLVHKAEQRQLANESYNRWSLFVIAIGFIAIGTPIILSYIFDSLESVRGTWIFSILMANSLGLYRAIKKEQTS